MKAKTNYMPLVHHARRLREQFPSNPFVTERVLHGMLEELCQAYNATQNPRVERQLKVEIDLLETAIA